MAKKHFMFALQASFQITDITIAANDKMEAITILKKKAARLRHFIYSELGVECVVKELGGRENEIVVEPVKDDATRQGRKEMCQPFQIMKMLNSRREVIAYSNRHQAAFKHVERIGHTL
jgi:hypothetical protein